VEAEVHGAGGGGDAEPDPLHDRDRPDAPAKVREFGLAACVVGPLAWALLRFGWDSPRAGFAVGAAVLLWGVLSAAAPGPMAPVLRGWLALTRPVGLVTTTLLLGTIYFLVLTPLGLVRRILRPDPLDRAVRRGAGGTYWKPKVLPPPESPRWFRPF
jgi:hypothetical protein